MGAGWRRIKEKVRESIPGASADLTSNARNKAMMKTATDFSLQVKKCEKSIRTTQAATTDLLTTTKSVMALPLPHTFEDTNEGAGSALTSMSAVGGPNFQPETVSRVGNEAGHKLETEVLAPLHRWQDVHLQLAGRFRELENTRLELDSRRRTFHDMSTKVTTMRAKLGTAGGGAKTEQKLDATIRTLSHKEAKLKVTTQNFEQQEALLARDLAALIADGQYLKHYVAAALRLQGGAMLGAADAFGELTSAPAPMSVGASPSGTPTGSASTGNAAGFGTMATAMPPAVGMSGPPSRTTSNVSNPYHPVGAMSNGGSANGGNNGGSMASDGRAYTSAGAASMGNNKRYSEPQEQQQHQQQQAIQQQQAAMQQQQQQAMQERAGVPGKGMEPVPAARYPVHVAPVEATDNPYSSVRGYTYS